MLGRLALSTCAAAWLAACAGSPAPMTPLPATEVSYLPPTGSPATSRVAFVQQDPLLVWGSLVDRLQQTEDLEITHLDEQGGYVVARYSGEPEPFVNCGWIVRRAPGAVEQMPAATPEILFGSDRNGIPLQLERELRLDGRLVVQVEPDGSDSVVTTTTTYVLTKIVETKGPQGDVRGQHRETISFETGERGVFARGTECQPTGQLERIVLDSLPATTLAGPRDRGVESRSLAVDAREDALASVIASIPCAEVSPQFGPTGELRLTGYVGSEEDVQRLRDSVARVPGIGAVDTALEVYPWPFCEVLQITAPYREANQQDGGGLDVAVADLTGEVLHAGDQLALEVGLPPEAGYLYLGYVQQDGRVGHIGTMPAREWATTAGRIRYDTGFEVAEPFGREMIVAITSERPLFDQARPAYESPEQFMRALREELAAAQPGQKIAADHLFITTQGADVR